jgi:hypothetical protein
MSSIFMLVAFGTLPLVMGFFPSLNDCLEKAASYETSRELHCLPAPPEVVINLGIDPDKLFPRKADQ